jgi:hypothetical protein
MKKLDFAQFIIARKTENLKALESIRALIAQSNNIAELEKLKESESVIAHRLRFLSTIDKNDSTLDAIGGAFVQLQLTESEFVRIEKDAKSIDKFSQLLESYSTKADKIKDKALKTALPYVLKTQFTTAAQLQKVLNHQTTRQSSMILNMLERLKLATVDRDSKVYTFKTDSSVFKRLSEIISA